MPLVYTNKRVRRSSAALLAFQSAKGVIVDDFSTYLRAWTERIGVDLSLQKSRPGPWMTELFTESTASRYSFPEQPRGSLSVMATPESVDFFLRSNWGPKVGTAYTLVSQVDKYATLAWIESYKAGTTQNLTRLPDVWIHRVVVRSARSAGRIVLIADYEGRGGIKIDPLNALPVGVVLPASPMAPLDTTIFTVRSCEFVRDPSGANESVVYTDLEIDIDQRLEAEWTMTDKWDVYKGGKTWLSIRFDGMLSNETWTYINRNRANIRERFRLIAKTKGAAKTLTMDFFEVDFVATPIGHAEEGVIRFRAVGRAHRDSSGNFATITIT